jgi:hypothetical protein
MTGALRLRARASTSNVAAGDASICARMIFFSIRISSGTWSEVTSRFAPGAVKTMFLPAELTAMVEQPVGRSEMPMPDVQMLWVLRLLTARRPKASSPTLPTIATLAPARTAATAWFAPLPPVRLR